MWAPTHPQHRSLGITEHSTELRSPFWPSQSSNHSTGTQSTQTSAACHLLPLHKSKHHLFLNEENNFGHPDSQ